MRTITYGYTYGVAYSKEKAKEKEKEEERKGKKRRYKRISDCIVGTGWVYDVRVLFHMILSNCIIMLIHERLRD